MANYAIETRLGHMSNHTTPTRLFAILAKGYSIHCVGQAAGSWVLQDKHKVGRPDQVPTYAFWLLTDNGGEWNIERINDSASLRSVPIEAHGMRVMDGTTAYRIACVVAGDEIDWEYTWTREEEAIILEVG